MLGVLAGLSLLLAAAVGAATFAAAAASRASSRDAERGRLEAAAAAVVELLLADPTPEADSPFDPIWAGAPFLEAERGRAEITPPGAEEGLRVRLEELSGRLGINWVRKEVLEELGVLLSGASAQELQQYREDTGLHLGLEAYERLVPPIALEALFTTYGWFNVNIADEFSLRAAALARTGDEALAEDLRARVQAARMRRPGLIARDALPAFLGPSYDRLFPVICAEPALNVHFVPPRIIEVLWAHHGADRGRCEQLLAERAGGELDGGRLKQLLGPAAEGTPLGHYLGVRTWFWRLEVAGPSGRLSWVLARLPVREGRELRVLEEQWSEP